MGMASVVVFINDSIGELQDDPAAGRRIADAIRGIYHDGKFRYGEAVCYGHVSGHDVVVRTGYGGKRLDHMESSPPSVAYALKAALEKEGYRVVKRRKPKAAGQ